jgi:deazaflavin-dependent oxidoreductase (nitroreductase family)
VETGSHHRRFVSGFGASLLRVRWLVRLPIWLYRARLGWLFGSRLLMLEHTGRRTGSKRYVVLEVVDRPEPGCYVVASGFGSASQWYQNVLADPRVRVYLGGNPAAPAEARLLSRAESMAATSAYSHRHRRAWAVLKPVFQATLGAPVHELPLVAFKATAH